MKVIFLDINGVLFLNSDEVNLDSIIFNEKSMKNLKKIIESTSSSIVLTSTWRTGYNNPENIFWNAILYNFTRYNIENKIIGVTPVINHEFKEVSRGIEITQWINSNPNLDNYIILDDDEVSDIDTNRLLLCDPFKGIDDYITSKAIKILNS